MLGRGEVPADIFFVGEAPGKAEDVTGEPFRGPSGVILDKAIVQAQKLADVKRGSVTYYITNLVACRPTSEKSLIKTNPEPTRDCSWRCRQRLMDEYEMVRPKEVVILGECARVELWRIFPAGEPLVHPAYILRRGGIGCSEYGLFCRGLAVVMAKVEEAQLYEQRKKERDWQSAQPQKGSSGRVLHSGRRDTGVVG